MTASAKTHITDTARNPRVEALLLSIAVVHLPVGDIERAIAFYTDTLGWTKVQDAAMGNAERWVTVAPAGSNTSFTLTHDKSRRPDNDGNRFSGIIIEVEDVYKIREVLKARGIEFTEEPRTMPWGAWAMFKDSEGNVHGVRSRLSESGSSH
jgi:predicted enzyme related to lactoylglutathione lyase